MGAVHLGVMELERNRQQIPKQLLSVPAPDHEGVIENTAVHAHRTIDLRIYNGGCTDHHTCFGQISVLTGLRYLPSILQVICIELLQIIRLQNIAGAYLSRFILDDGIDRNCLISDQLLTHGQSIELLDV